MLVRVTQNVQDESIESGSPVDERIAFGMLIANEEFQGRKRGFGKVIWPEPESHLSTGSRELH